MLPGSVAGCRKFSGPSHNAMNSGGGQQAQGQTMLPNWSEFLPPPPEHPPPSAAGSETNPVSRLLVPVSVFNILVRCLICHKHDGNEKL